MKNEAVRIALTRKDGSLAIMEFLTLGRGSILPSGAEWVADGWWSRRPTIDALAEEIKRTGEDVASFRLLNDGELPTDRTYRDAWVDTGKKVETDMAKAREIHLKNLRKLRAPLLKDLDMQWMRATGQGKKKEADEIEAKRQALRDMPTTLASRIGNATTPEELKTVALE